SLAFFEIACVVVVLLTLATMTRTRGAGSLLRDYAALAIAGFVGEETCIASYRFYAYANGWHLRLHHVPLLVPLIWPLVILSARAVVSELWPTLRRARPLAVAALVVFDASLVEVVAVRAGLWSWAEPGHLGVPLIGILGWGYFAAGTELALDRDRPALAVVLGPLAAHALIQLTWWGLFRWTLRGAFGDASTIGVALISLMALAVVLSARRQGRSIPFAVAAPRMIAASLFVALLMSTAGRDVSLWAHTLSVAIPYLAATSYALTGTRSQAARPAATASSRG
ncbi:MAG: carotenoid biosynthesis protein, partial [Polyangiales bacterium]